MEFGPRALGSRSILADSRSTEMQKNLNLKIKYRESFRPFAPIVLREDLKEWFELDQDVPYMTFVANVNKNKLINLEHDKAYSGLDKLKISNSTIPAVTHVDNSARVQSVDEYRNKKLYKLLKKFKEKTGCPVMVNTSFNVRGEPIVNTPQEAFSCFMGTEMDILVIGNCFLIKKEQNPNLKQDYKDKFDLD
jgi:carbamoyltransferase